MDDMRAGQLSREQPRQIPAPPSQAHQQRHRSPEPDCPRQSNLPGIRETMCFARDPSPQRNASSDPPPQPRISVARISRNTAFSHSQGHKSAVNAMGGYADRSENSFDDPRVESIASLVKRRLGMAIGIVTNTEIEDATPAAMIAHRSEEHTSELSHEWISR